MANPWGTRGIPVGLSCLCRGRCVVHGSLIGLPLVYNDRPWVDCGFPLGLALVPTGHIVSPWEPHG